MSRALLITGATGRQGGALIDTILSAPTKPPFTIFAVTRNPDSPAAKALASKSPTIKLLKGDQDDSAALFQAAQTPIWGVFSVQMGIGPKMTPAREEAQGKAMIDAAIEHGVQHFVYASAIRGKPPTETIVPQFQSKHHVESYLFEKAASSGMDWTVLRPGVFFENLTPDILGLVFAGSIKYIIGQTKSVQYIAVADIGWFAHQAFVYPDRYEQQCIDLAGDSLTYFQMEEVYQKCTGSPLPLPYGWWLLPWLVCNVFLKDLGIMFRYFSEENFPADIPHLKEMHPDLMTFSDWLQTQSAVKKVV